MRPRRGSLGYTAALAAQQRKAIERQNTLDVFCQFSMNNILLIIHRKDWSEAVNDLNDIRDHYQGEQANFKSTKLRVNDLFENTKKELKFKINEIIKDIKNQASSLIEKEKK